MKEKQQKRSPLKASPLRNPGQSLDEEIAKIMDEDVSASLAVIIMAFMIMVYEWWRWYTNSPPQPGPITLAVVIISIYTFRKLFKLKKRVKTLKQGRDGEKAVGQYLESLRSEGYQVLHDLIGAGFNVDHVLIGPAGVFTIETKTISKPAKGKAEITYDCKNVTIDGFTPDRDPITQGKTQAHWLQGVLEECVGKRFKVQSIVVYPGWFIRRIPENAKCEVLVLNPRILPDFLEKSFHKLSPDEIRQINSHLSRYIRTSY